MIVQKIVLTVMPMILMAAPALAQSSSSEVRRDIDQEMRIERGLKSGQITSDHDGSGGVIGVWRGSHRPHRIQGPQRWNSARFRAVARRAG